jgi:hypothetical protein
VRAGRPLGLVGATAVVGAGTAANRLAGLPLASMAATPRAVGDGKLWLLVTSGLLADTPWLPSLFGFAIVLAVALYVLPVRDVVLVAAAGQIVSALIVYGIIGLARLVEPHTFASVIDLPDFGVSAMIAAWIGAVAAVAWARHDHLLVVAGCLACLGVGLAFRPTITFLDSEHIVAFAIGIACLSSRFRRIAVPIRKAVAVALSALGVAHA